METTRINPGVGWTPGSKGEGSRSSALWGKRTSGIVRLAVLALAVALCAPMGALAASPKLSTLPKAFVTPSLLADVQARHSASYKVIVSASNDPSCGKVASLVQRAISFYNGKGSVKRSYSVINGVSATLNGDIILAVAQLPCLTITPDIKVAKASLGLGGVVSGVTSTVTSLLSNEQSWPQAAGLASLWNTADTPAIAVVDSGVDASRADFGGRVVANVNLYTGSSANLSGDGRGHGTAVAAIAAGSAANHAGAAPGAKIVSLDVLGDDGSGTIGDAIAAADWIYQHKDEYNIKVANFSLNAGAQSSFINDPLDKAVERLWFGGVTVVAAAGNYGTGDVASGVLTAPANDPFVITVGASDHSNTADAADDFNAPWSAYGHTPDGFSKPELGAPGRVMTVPVASGSSMIVDHPERLVAPGYMWISGTSFAAPVVSGAAAHVLAAHPDWKPDQVKGALMISAKGYSPLAPQFSLGVGVVDAAAAAAVVDPPNPNAALNQFVATDAATSLPVFDSASWATAASANASWATASWATASWATASWATASWATASWATASWATASWATASWATASWATASWATNVEANASWYQ